MTEIPESLLRMVTSEYNVTEAEFSALRLALTGQTAESIAIALDISAPAVRKRLGSVYQKFGIAGGTAGKLEVLRNLLQQRDQLSTPVATNSQCDFGEAPDIPVFFGRTQELDTVQQWIIKDRCRLVAIFGMAGIGKTALSIELANKLKDRFEYVIWRSLRHAPSIKDILADLIEFLSNKNETKIDWSDTEVGISQLIVYLRKYRCLVLLDNAESILLGGNRAGQYREGYSGYGELLKQVGEVPHQSCLILTSREFFKEIAPLEVSNLKVQALQLDGLNHVEAKKIFVENGSFSGGEDEWKKLINHYAGNPLALKIVATTIQEVFAGKISDFLNQGTAVFLGDIRNLLNQQYERLTFLEKDIMYWLALNLKPVSISELQEDIISNVSPVQLIEALESLKRRSLINIKKDKDIVFFTLQAVVMEYIIDHFTRRISEEITSEISQENISIFKSHTLIKAQTEGKIRSSQIRLILEPIAERLIDHFGNKISIKEHLLQIISMLREKTPLTSGYAGGNVINLLCHLGIDLSGCDFSNLKICQAYLVGANLHNVNFASSDLSKSSFTDIFDSILSVTFDPMHGERLATGDANGRIRLWQVNDGEELASWEAHANWVRSVAFSPDGKILASSSDDHTVKLWDVDNQKLVKILEGHTNWVRSVAFSSLCEGGYFIASGSSDQTIRLWDLRSYKCVNILKGHNYFIHSVAFSPDQKTLASGSADQTVKLWDIKTGKCLNTLEGHTKLVRSVAFSLDGNTLASGSADQTIKLWDVKTGLCIKTLEGHTELVQVVMFSPDGKTLASGSADQTIKLWDVKTGLYRNLPKKHTNSVRSIAFSPDGKTLASSSYDKTVRFWDIDTHQCIQILQGYTNWVHSVAVSPDGKTLASSSDDKTVRLWDIAGGECIRTFEGHTSRVLSVVFSPDGQTLVSGGDDQIICFWDVLTGQCLKRLHQADRVRSVAFSPDGQILAIGSADRNIKLYNARTGLCFDTLQDHRNWVQSVAFSPDGEILASASDDKTVRLWSIHSGKCIGILETHTMRIWSVAFSPDGQTLASCSDDKTVRLWNIGTRENDKTLHLQDRANSVAFSPDGKVIACASVNCTVEIWDVEASRCLKTLTGHNNWVRSVAFNLDGETLFSGSHDGAIKQWNFKTGECINTLIAKRPYEGMNINGVVGLTQRQRETLKELGATSYLPPLAI